MKAKEELDENLSVRAAKTVFIGYGLCSDWLDFLPTTIGYDPTEQSRVGGLDQSIGWAG